MKLIVPTFLAVMISSPLCSAQPTTSPSTVPAGPTIIRLTLHPMATSQPALQYELLPPLNDVKPGDAAYKYQLADAHLVGSGYDHDGKIEDRLLDAPRDAFPIADATAFTTQKSTFWIDDGARCETAHWDTDFRNSGIKTLLPYLNCARSEANIVAVAGRLAIAKGDYAAAQHCIQTNLSMARQLNDNPFLVQGLVASGIVRLGVDKNVTDWIARDRSPNLYWGLSNLPIPFIDLAAVEQKERAELPFTDQPYIAQALSGTLPADQWPQIIRFMVRLQYLYKTGVFDVDFDLDKKAEEEVDKQYTALITAELPASRKYLTSTGMSEAEAAALPDAKAIGLCWIRQYKLASDEQWKGWSLPYPQAATILLATQAVFDASHQSDHNLLLKSFAYPLIKPRYTFAQVDRQIALFRIVEALRDYTAHHRGNVPDSLDKITDLPIPADPITGRSFAFHREKNTAIIDAPAPAEFSAASGRRYELTFINP